MNLLLSTPLQLAQRHLAAERIQPGVRALNCFIHRHDFFIERGVLPEGLVGSCSYIPDLVVEDWVPEPN